ncbi:MAG TPA: glycosyltransferase family 39 protein [Candidatus Limnocylindrales bacterium]|nr:glycosyltransferase family 39 protein [Candidatus Limnocylindrales bacterium]
MEARLNRFGPLLIIAAVLLIRIPFLNQAAGGDDDIYLTEAAHAQIDPLHPSHTPYVFRAETVDLRGHPHPPLDAWTLAALIAIFGGLHEAAFHAAYIGYSVIAALSVWSLAKRFSPHPLWAVLLFIAVPPFVVNGNTLESDLPFLAFWLAAIAFFVADRLLLSVLAMALAVMAAYQAIVLTPILAAYVWLFRRGDRRAWVAIFAAPAVMIGWQIFERMTTGAMPAAVLAGYMPQFQTIIAKARTALALSIQSQFLIFGTPLLLLAAWPKRRDPAVAFLLSWIGIFFAAAIAIFFDGPARYLLPMAAPLAIFASHVRWRIWILGVQLPVALGLAAVNYQHWNAYRTFAETLPWPQAPSRVYVNGEWGLRTYLEIRGAEPLTHGTKLQPGDVVVTSELGRAAEVNAPATPIATTVIRPAIPLRTIGLESNSGYSTTSRGFWPFGISTGVIDRVTAVKIGQRNPTLEYLTMKDPQAAAHIVTGISASDGWMGADAILVLKSPAVPTPVQVKVFIPDNAPARRIEVLLDGREVKTETVPRPGLYTVESGPVKPAAATATVEIRLDETFQAPPDTRDLGAVLVAAGFRP